ncbi:MAG: carboxypeptidase-like regulatory domain-containing protein [Saprospiraceae bacterium]|nr:carboxypeptidase-like regulatory domain-containing protein [Saprospiraceae bacterium]
MRLFLLLAGVLIAGLMTAQDATIRGTIFDQETGEPIIYGNVVVAGTTMGTTTDLDGFFTLNLKAGSYRLIATYIGFDTTTVDVTVVPGEVRYVNLYMSGSSIELEQVDVSARRAEQRSEVYISKVTVTQAEIRALPSTGSEADIAQYLQVLPGVISTGDQGGQIYIRGGSPIQNKVLLDGMTIYNPFHSIGFFSVFETETIKSVDVLTGGFGAEHGGRISAVVDIKTREGSMSRYSGLVSASPFQAKALIEGPIARFNPDKEGSASFMLTAKHSYLDQTSRDLYSYATDSLGLPYGYTDVYGKITLLGGNGSKLNLFGFNFKDDVLFQGVANLAWDATGGGFNFRLIPNQSRLLVNGTISYSDYNILLREGDEDPRTSGINGFTAALDFTYFGQDSELNYGFEVNGFRTDLRFRNFVGITIDQFNNTTEIAGYVKYRQVAGRLIIEPSLRAQFYSSLGDFSVEPRFAFKYKMGERVRFKLSGGLYSQNLISTVNERDIVNLFVGFLSGPEERLFEPGTRRETTHRLQKSIHGVAGLEIDLSDRLQLNIEPYFKRFSQLINVNRNKLSEQDPDFATETGDASGLDISARYETATTFLWATYSLGNVKRDDGDQEYPTNFDRRHNINMLASFKFGRNLSWEFGARWNYGSGFPFTLTQGFYGQFNFLDGLDTPYQTGNPDLGIIYADERNGGRLPAYHRMDISLKKKFELGEYSSIEATASVTNVYDRANIFYFDRIRFERVDQLPILPSLGLKFTF